jgi:glucokinase
MYGLGVDIGGTAIKLGLFTEQGDLLEKWKIKTRIENNGSHILSDVAIAIEEKLKIKNIGLDKITGMGIGIPGAVTSNGTILKCSNLGWGVFSPVLEVNKLIDIKKIKVANDANVAALGEMWRGGGRGYSSIVMITLGTGVGGGVIIKGNILTGCKGAAGEIGHLTVESDEVDACGCGNRGCLEQYASATGIVRLAKKKLAEDDLPSMLRDGEVNSKTIFDAAKDGDDLANEVVERFGKYLGVSLSNVASTIDPDAFVIGGGMSRAGRIIIDVVEKYYNQYAMYALQGKDIKLAKLGNDAGIYGAVKMVL